MGLGQQLLSLAAPSSFILFTVASMLFSLALIPLALAPGVTAGPLPKTRLSLKSLARIPLPGVTGAVAARLLCRGFFSMTPVFDHGIGLSVPQIATLMASGLIGGLLMQWPLAKTSNLFDRRTEFIVLTFLKALVALAMMPLTKSGFSALIIGIILYRVNNFALYPLPFAKTNDYLSAEQVLPAAASMILAYFMGANLGPLLAGQTMVAVGPKGCLFTPPR